MNESYFKYWGKANPNYPGEPKWHPLIYHCLDVAAVARTYLSIQDNLLSSLCAILQAEPKTVLDMVAFVSSFHDIGKMSKPFQQSMPKLASPDDEQSEKRHSIGHVLPGCRIWNELSSLQDLRDEIGMGEMFDTWSFSALAHHGNPPQLGGTPIMLSQYFPKENRDAMEHLIRDVAGLFLDGKRPFTGSQVKADYNHASWIIAGIIVVSDWIGSNHDWFRYSELFRDGDAIDSLRCYLNEKALPAARIALAKCGLHPVQVSQRTGIHLLFPSIERPTELQTLTESVEIVDTPTLFVIEDATGTGKTEAAIVLAHRLMMAGRGEGIYFALPTMATSNRMYERIRKVYRKLYDGGAPSLVLAHSAGKTALAMERHFTEEKTCNEDSFYECNEWIADNRKKALLAHIGVGTIDQALMGALRIRHQSMRLLGLSRKVLVIDEVHACEPYVLELLRELLAFHAAQGGSAILLSATIPTGLRRNIVNAFAKGINAQPELFGRGSFPLITCYDHSLKQIAVPVPDENELKRRPSSRPISVKAIYSIDEAWNIIEKSLQDGKCVCWVRNTVIDAFDAYDKFREFFPVLFHARFALGDRLRIGTEIENRFGLSGCPDDRRGKLVIATQVVEQSLDVDFDVMITDLSPIDSLIQRSGRLHRHRIRDERILYVFMPDPDKVVGADWYSSVFPRASRHVYPHHGHLWLTARWLVDHGRFRMPFDAREMIEFVYEGDVDAPAELLNSEIKSAGDDAAGAQIGRLKALDFDEGYSPEGWKTWLDDESAPTRLGAPTSTVVLCQRRSNGCLHPFIELGEHGWDASSLTVRSALIFDENPPDKEAISAVKAVRKKRIFVIMTQNGVLWTGRALNKKCKIVVIEYSHNRGLQVFET